MQNANIFKVKEEKLFIWHNKTSNMSYQSREFHKFFRAINCCSFKTHGFHKIFAIFHFTKSLRNATENFRTFREMFRSLETIQRSNTRKREKDKLQWTSIFLKRVCCNSQRHLLIKKVTYQVGLPLVLQYFWRFCF